jgi:xanthine dehydrogenase iron-sulfur cluster and FAD-binding subunit A
MSGVAVIEEARAGWPSAATAYVTRPFTPADLSEAEIRERMSGNLCRCALLSQYRRRRRRSGGEGLNDASLHALQSRRSGDSVAAHAEDPHLAFIAGGIDLLGLMKDRAALPERLLDINRLPDMAQIEALPDGGLRIGALARMSDVAADPEVRAGAADAKPG